MCDHADDTQVKMLFERIKMEAGYLDILVNNPPQSMLARQAGTLLGEATRSRRHD
jgi:hypothetical protein